MNLRCPECRSSSGLVGDPRYMPNTGHEWCQDCGIAFKHTDNKLTLAQVREIRNRDKDFDKKYPYVYVHKCIGSPDKVTLCELNGIFKWGD